MTERKEFTDADRAALRELSPIDNDKAMAFAEEHGFTVYQVRAVAVRDDEIEYKAKPRTSKDGSPVESKADIVSEIADSLNVDADIVESLTNATKAALQRVRDALAS